MTLYITVSIAIDYNPEELLELLKRIINIRSADIEKEWKPIFIFNIMWDKMVGIGIAEDYKITDLYQEIIQKSAAFNIHFIIVVRLAKPFSFILPFINHKICAQSDEDTSNKLLDSPKAMKLSQDDGVARMAIYLKGIKEEKFKIYLSYIDKNKLKKETVIKERF